MDVQTVAFLFTTATLIFCFVAAALWRLMPEERSLPTWIGASSVTFLGGVLVGLRGDIPDVLSVVIGNVALVWGSGLVFLGARRLLARPTPYVWDLTVAALAAVSGLGFAWLIDDIDGRIVLAAIFSGPFQLAAAWNFWRGPKPLTARDRPVRSGQHTSELLTALILLVGGVLLIVRAALLIGMDVGDVHFGAQNLFLALPYAYAVLLSVWLSSVLTLHVSARLHRRLVAANDRAVAANRELQILSRTDPLTQLHNRLHCDEILESEINRSRRYGSPLSVVMADLDNFKTVNDRYGHQVGDRVLARVAEVLRKELRQTDAVGRWGGEEFLLILPHTDLDRATDVAEKVRRALAATAMPVVGHVTASLGVSSFIPGDSGLRILARADEALYDAKRGGRNRVCTLAGDRRGPVASVLQADDWVR